MRREHARGRGIVGKLKPFLEARRLAGCGARHLLCVFGLLVTADGASGQAVVDESRQQRALIEQVQSLFVEEKFDELDRMADEFRRTRARSSGGYPQLAEFYWVFGKCPANVEWIEHVQRAQKWVSKKQDSVTARIALGYAHISCAWAARGSGWAGSVTEEGWKLFKEHLESAWRTLVEARKLPTKDAGLYSMLCLCGQGMGLPKSEVMEYFEKGLSIDAFYYPLYFHVAYYLLPRWHGQPGEWIKFAEDVSTTKPQEGEAIYARIIWAVVLSLAGSAEFKEDEELFARNGISWKRVKQGFLDIESRHPGSLRNLSAFCYLACLAGDRETACALFAKLAKHYDGDVWNDYRLYQKWRIWANPAPAQESAQAPVPVHNVKRVVSLAYAPDGKRLAIGLWGGDVVLWDPVSNKEIARLDKIAADGRRLAFSPNGRLLGVAARSSRDEAERGAVTIWDVVSGKIYGPLVGHARPVWYLAFSPEGRFLYTGGGQRNVEGEIMQWDLATLRGQRVDCRLARMVSSIAVSPDGKMLAFQQSSWVMLWDIVAKRLTNEASRAQLHSEACSCLAFSADGRVLVTADRKGTLRLSEVPSGRPMATQLAGHPDVVTDLQFSRDGRVLASCSWDRTVRFWEPSSGRELAMVAGSAKVNCLAFSPDGTKLAFGCGDGAVRMCDVSALLAGKPADDATVATLPLR